MCKEQNFIETKNSLTLTKDANTALKLSIHRLTCKQNVLITCTKLAILRHCYMQQARLGFISGISHCFIKKGFVQSEKKCIVSTMCLCVLFLLVAAQHRGMAAELRSPRTTEFGDNTVMTSLPQLYACEKNKGSSALQMWIYLLIRILPGELKPKYF